MAAPNNIAATNNEIAPAVNHLDALSAPKKPFTVGGRVPADDPALQAFFFPETNAGCSTDCALAINVYPCRGIVST